jgi:hypothetical protein
MALGARASNLLRLVLSHTLILTAGVLLGAAAASGLTRLMRDLLYKVSPRDPLAFGVAFLVMTIASLSACFLPAWRDPDRSGPGIAGLILCRRKLTTAPAPLKRQACAKLHFPARSGGFSYGAELGRVHETIRCPEIRLI